MTPAQIIAEVRNLAQDTLVPYRYSDTELLGYVNQTLKRMASLRPDLFTYFGDLALTANTVVQNLPADAQRLIDIFWVKDANAMTEVEREVLERAYPTWVSDPSDVPLNFMRHPRTPTRFFVYPRPLANTVVVVEYAVAPATYALSDTIALSDSYYSVLVDGVMFLVSSVDDEHVNSNRAKLFLDSFLNSLATNTQARELVDNDSGAVRQMAQPRGKT